MSTRTHSPQRGVAAIEFALVLLVLLLALYGIATFGAVLYTQQAMSRAAEEGARAVQTRPSLTTADIQGVVWDALADSLIKPDVTTTTRAERRDWVANNVVVDVSAPTPAVTVTVTYPYRANRLLPSLPFLNSSLWMPDLLKSHATAAI